LTLLPFVHPDVIKLDLRLVQDRTDGETPGSPTPSERTASGPER